MKADINKRCVYLTAVVLVTFMLSLMLCSCTFYQNGENVDGLQIYFSKIKRDAFVSYYVWDADPENMNVVIPDTFKGYRIDSLGGYFGRGVPSPFSIIFDVDKLCPGADDIYSTNSLTDRDGLDGAEVKYLDFKLYLGRYVADVDYMRMTDYVICEYNDGAAADKIIVERVCVECDGENQSFYAKDGKLYYKDGERKDETVEGFFYSDYELSLSDEA